MTNDAHSVQVEEALNLKAQLGSLNDPGDQDFIFMDTSPPTRWNYVYSSETGERIRVKSHRLMSTLEKRLPDGSKAFVAKQEDAPEYRLGTVKCFLARGSNEREKVDELNISPGYYCIAEHLANEGAAQIHAEHKHPTRWRMYQAAIEREEREADRARQDAQIAAIMELARGKAESAAEFVCDICGQPAKSAFGLQAHKRSHKEA